MPSIFGNIERGLLGCPSSYDLIGFWSLTNKGIRQIGAILHAKGSFLTSVAGDRVPVSDGS